MPIDPRELEGMEVASVAPEGRTCHVCGYDLTGLMDSGRCPECGTPIRAPATRSLERLKDNMTYAPRPWLVRQQYGGLLACVTALFVIPVAIAMLFMSDAMAASIALGMSVCWWCGVLLLTQPRPKRPSSKVDPHAEWRVLRAITRFSQAAWIAYAGMWLAMTMGSAPTGVVSNAMGAINLGLSLIGAIGLLAFCGYMSNLAHWAGDSSLYDRYQQTPWLIGLAILILLVSSVLPLLGLVLWVVQLIAGLFIFIGVPILMYLLAFNTLSLTQWALRNHDSAMARDDRRREKMDAAKRERDEETQRWREAVDSMPPPAHSRVVEADADGADLTPPADTPLPGASTPRLARPGADSGETYELDETS